MIALVPVVAVSQPPPAPTRTEVPIRDVTLSDGVHRYGVPITVGGTEALAGLDTGASGLRLRLDAPGRSSVKPLPRSETYTFGSGAHLEGTAGTVRLAIGQAQGDLTVHLVNTVNCIAKQPDCPGRLGPGYGFLGDGLPGEGFKVLLGANMGRTSIDNPLMAVGARRWIIELPRPGEKADGRLILNPTDDDVKDFATVRLVGGYREQDGGLHDAIWACLRNTTTTERVCGPSLLDTGAFNIRVANAELKTPWPKGTPATLDLMNDGTTVRATVKITVGGDSQGVGQTTLPTRGAVLLPGVATYYAYAVLYDPRRGVLGFKARPPVPGLPQAAAPR